MNEIKEIELTPSFNTTPTQIYKRLFEIISKEKIYLKEEYESLEISFKIENQTKKYINFAIPENKENYNKELMKLIYELKKQVDILEVQIKELKEITELKKYKNIIYNLNSTIIGNNYEYNYLLKKWINPYNKLEANLLYKLSRDGPESTTFHKLCDNKGATLTLFYLKTGEKVGFYLSDPFDSDSGWKYDENIFIFNLNKKQQYKIKITQVYCNTYYNKLNCGPTVNKFGCRDETNLNYIYVLSRVSEVFDKSENILPIKEEINKYEVQEIEIFQILES